LLAGIGSAQLAKCDNFVEQRRALAARYREAFSAFDELENPPLGEDPAGHAWHLFILRLRPGLLNLNRNQFIEELKKRGVGSSVHFIPLHLHPFYQRAYGYRQGQLPNAEAAYSCCLSLPIFPGMTSAEQMRVIGAVGEIVAEHRKRKSTTA
jgi:perosamine synthetase